MREKKKTLDKKVDSFKLRKIAKKQKLQEKGITLVALVVTIIILLILAGVTLNIALSDNGLFNKTKKAAEEYKEAQSEEEDLISQIATQMYSEYVGATVEGYDLTEKTVTISGTKAGVDSNTKDSNGNTIVGINEECNQIFKTDTDMKWRVWDFDGNILRIIGDPTTQQLALKGVAGYNNGVWAMNYICKELYENGKEGVSATSLKRTDIEKVSTYDYTKFKGSTKGASDSGNENFVYYGESRVYTENTQYPKIWEENDKDWEYEYKDGRMTGKDKEGSIWEKIGYNDGTINNEMITKSNSVTFKQSSYEHVYKETEFINEKYFDLIFKSYENKDVGVIWLACRDTYLFSDSCNFRLPHISSINNWCAIQARGMVNSDRNLRGYLYWNFLSSTYGNYQSKRKWIQNH